ncbi:MAG: LLM class flavin-dependent oxidoreductase, partial [Candidatus Freyarchaeota archaeon]
FKKLAFGAIVLCNSYRNPALLAKMGATLQLLTGGRFVLGIGAGWKEDEYHAYGYEFPKAAVRIKQLEEGVQIIRKMWTEDVVTFEGKYFKVRKAYCNPKPKPLPPIMIGGGGEKLTLRVVARHADWWNLPNATVTEYQHKLEVLKDYCVKIRRNCDEIKKTWAGYVAIAQNHSDALKVTARSPFTSEIGIQKIIVGDPRWVLEKVKALVDVGVEYFILRFLDFPSAEGAKLFAEEVIPRFK